MVNCNSVDYNIISATKPILADASIKSLREADEKIGFKKKAIAEMTDLGKPFSPNIHETYKVDSLLTRNSLVTTDLFSGGQKGSVPLSLTRGTRMAPPTSYSTITRSNADDNSINSFSCDLQYRLSSGSSS